MQENLNLAACRVEMEDQYSILSNVNPFICQWKDCGIEFFCPNKFYRHVDKHGLDTKPPSDEEGQNEGDGKTSTDLKFPCTWDG